MKIEIKPELKTEEEDEEVGAEEVEIRAPDNAEYQENVENIGDFFESIYVHSSDSDDDVQIVSLDEEHLDANSDEN